MESSKRFATPEDEISYWRSLAQTLKQELEESKEELEEYNISSHELESELEAQLRQLEKRNKELETNNSKLKAEVDSLRMSTIVNNDDQYLKKLEQLQKASHTKATELENELAQVLAYNDELKKYIRKLEQANDDLEQAKRYAAVSLEESELRLYEAIEKNVYLESELDEKETLLETIQGLKDEARDLKSEIDVRQNLQTRAAEKLAVHADDSKMADSGYDGQHHHLPSPTSPSGKSTPTTPTSKGIPPSANRTTPLTPSVQIAAMNIVGDLLRKVEALEAKLATGHNFVKDHHHSEKVDGNSPSNSSPRTKRLTRGAPVPSQQDVKMSGCQREGRKVSTHP